MGKLILLALGGSGERVINSLTMLMAAGMKLEDSTGTPVDLQPVFLDTDLGSKALENAISRIGLYRELHNRFAKLPFTNDGISSTLFVSKIRNPSRIIIDGAQLTNLKTMIERNTFDDDKRAELNMLFDESALSVSLEKGFIGLPYIGTIALNYLLNENDAFNGIINNINGEDKVFLVSSIFGGTGAAGFPLIINKIQRNTDIGGNENTIALGTLTLLPYFDFSNRVVGPEQIEGFSIDPAKFESKSIAALLYYDQHLLLDGISAEYYIGNVNRSTYTKALGGVEQDNPTNMIEVLGATSIFHFCRNGVPRNRDNNDVAYYEYWFGTSGRAGCNLSDISPNDIELKRSLVRIQLFEYLIKHKLNGYVTDNDGVFSKKYGFTIAECKALMSNRTLCDFFKTYESWRGELKSDVHDASIKFNYFNRLPGNNEYITQCFDPDIARTHTVHAGFLGFLGLSHAQEVVDPDFLGKMSDGSNTGAQKGWDTSRKEDYTLHLIMYAIEKVLNQENPQIVQL